MPAGDFPIHSARDYETAARERLDPAVLAHVMGGAGADRAAARNLADFDSITITPRVLKDLTAGSTACNLGGTMRPHPIWLAPIAFHGLFHDKAERETAAAAAATDTCLVASTLSTLTLEEIASAAGPDRWFQLYVQPSREATLALVRRAESAGYGAIMVTVDAPVHAPGLSTLRAGFKGGQTAANLSGYPVLDVSPERGESRIFQGFMRHAATWSDIAWLRRETRLPLWLKGVMHPDDAREALGAGVDGLVVSNHGGRELDAAPSSSSVLPAIRQAVGPDAALLFDGGVRSGEDVFKAIALGADGAMVGRLQACALAANGAVGVGHMIKLMREELEVTMALTGCASLADIRGSEVRRSGHADRD